MRVHVSPSTYERIKGKFDMQPRQVVVKGKGEMTTYLVLGKIRRGLQARSMLRRGGSASSMRSMVKAIEMAAVLEEGEEEGKEARIEEG